MKKANSNGHFSCIVDQKCCLQWCFFKSWHYYVWNKDPLLQSRMKGTVETVEASWLPTAMQIPTGCFQWQSALCHVLEQMGSNFGSSYTKGHTITKIYTCSLLADCLLPAVDLLRPRPTTPSSSCNRIFTRKWIEIDAHSSYSSDRDRAPSDFC